MFKEFLKMLKKGSKSNEKVNLFKGELNTELEPSIFSTGDKYFLGDYIGKFVHGYEYLVKEGILLLDEPAEVVRKANKEELNTIDIYKKEVLGHMTPIVFEHQIKEDYSA